VPDRRTTAGPWTAAGSSCAPHPEEPAPDTEKTLAATEHARLDGSLGHAQPLRDLAVAQIVDEDETEQLALVAGQSEQQLLEQIAGENAFLARRGPGRQGVGAPRHRRSPGAGAPQCVDGGVPGDPVHVGAQLRLPPEPSLPEIEEDPHLNLLPQVLPLLAVT